MENVQSKFSQPKSFMKPNEVLVHIMNVFSFIYSMKKGNIAINVFIPFLSF